MIMEYPVKQSTNIKGDMLNTTYNPNIYFYFKNSIKDSTSKIKELLADAVRQTSKEKIDLSLVLPSNVNDISAEQLYYKGLKVDTSENHFYTRNECLVACNLLNYQQTYTDIEGRSWKGERVKRSSLEYNIQVMNTHSMEVISSKSFSFQGKKYMVSSSKDSSSILSEDDKKSIASDIVNYIDSAQSAFNVDALNKTEIVLQNLSYSEYTFILSTINEFQTVVKIEEKNIRKV